MIFAIDFDGTLCVNKFPEIGEPDWAVINKCIELQQGGHTIILNTCRVGKFLQDAVQWCAEKGLVFNFVNENCTERVNQYADCRKIGADAYIDDKNLSIEQFIQL